MARINNIMVTGGAGFIGSNFIMYVFNKTDFSGKIVNVDKLTYSGNLMNLEDINREYAGKRYFFERLDICDFEKMCVILKKYEIDTVVHFAAESHVDKSILGPKNFVETNIYGTFSLLETCRSLWPKDDDTYLFHHVSTDEVYGSLGEEGYFYENSPYDPRSPYSASKASSDHLVNAYYHTYNLPFTLSNCSNNYGPYQFPEKLIPLMILNILDGNKLPVYGDGKNIRDWLYVEDHAAAVWKIIKNAKPGKKYNIGGECQLENIEVVNILCEKAALLQGKNKDFYKHLISFVKDRPGHDRRYAINCDKIKGELGWKPLFGFEEGIELTLKWYMDNRKWAYNTLHSR